MTTMDAPAFSVGNYAPVRDELTAFDLPVRGQVPPELEGRLLRIGPNPIAPIGPEDHWFTGTGMVHGVRLREGRAEWYRNRYVRDDQVVAELGEPPVTGPASRLSVNAANTNVIRHGGNLMALVEAGGLPVLLDAELGSIGRTDFGGSLPAAFTAHPKIDPVTGDMHAVTYFWEREGMQYVCVDTAGQVRRTVDVVTPGRPMVHDMAITATYVVLLDLPVVFDLNLAMTGAQLPYVWSPEYGARVGLLTKDGSEEVRWFELPGPCWVFHVLNAFDDGDDVVLDVSRYDRVFDHERHGPNDAQPSLWRWRLNAATSRVSETLLDDRPQEFPRHDERLLGQPHRYAYTVLVDDAPAGQLLKHDLQTGSSERYEHGPGRLTLETIFVPTHDSTAEDDGWLMSYVYDGTRDRSDVVILHAQDLTAPVAVVELPARVPFGFHSNWIPDR